MEKCIYCGHNELNADTNDRLKCRRCGLVFTRPDYDDVNNILINAHLQPHDQASNDNTGTVYADEEDTLNSAWQLMQAQAWEKALAALVPAAVPSQHPLEFAVWRNICQSAPTLTDNDLKRRSPLLGILHGNIQRPNYFLPACEGEKRYLLLQRLYQALMLLGKLEVNCLTNYNTASTLTDTTNGRRADMLVILAEVLESQNTDPEYGTEYLKMSLQLYQQCLITASEICSSGKTGSFISMSTDKLQLAPKTRSHINAKIEQLNAILTKIDPGFVPQKKAPDPIIMPVWLHWLLLLGWLLPLFMLPFAYLLKDALDARGLGFLLIAKNDDELMTGCFIIFGIVYLAITVRVHIKYGCESYKQYFDDLVRKQKQELNAYK